MLDVLERLFEIRDELRRQSENYIKSAEGFEVKAATYRETADDLAKQADYLDHLIQQAGEATNQG